MSNRSDEQLGRAFDNVTVIQVAAHFGVTLKMGVQKSPFREDKKGESFSVFAKGFRYKDQARDEIKGGSWEMVKLCAAECGRSMSGKEIRDLLVELNGETPEKLTRGQVRREVKEKRGQLYKDAAAAREELPELGRPEPPEWSDEVRTRWEEGLTAIEPNLNKLGESRGWCFDFEVMRWLAEQNKTSAPLLPWSDEKGNKRCWAWLVEKPVARRGSGGAALDLVPVGYHARFRIFQKDGAKKSWIYVPYIPVSTRPDGSKKQLTDFQRLLQEQAVNIPAYPFVLGDLSGAKLVVILEGQFDAVTFALAFGWLQHGFPAGVAVFGLRGVQSQAAMLSAYGLWLRRHKPFVWIIGDNDEAGRNIDKRDPSNQIKREPTFVDRLRAQGCTVRAELINHSRCKDFNDVWQVADISPGDMQAWAAHVGCGEFV